jgi:hypothetical protein
VNPTSAPISREALGGEVAGLKNDWIAFAEAEGRRYRFNVANRREANINRGSA